MGKMWGIIPSLQRFIGKFLIRITEHVCIRANSNLQTISRGKLATNLEEKLVSFERVIVKNLKGNNFSGGAQESFKLRQHAASPSLQPASGQETVQPPAILLDRPPPA